MKLLQTFENLPSKLNGHLADHFNDISNDCYRRWYPAEADKEGAEPWMKELNQWLLDNGMTIDTNDKYFHVLIVFYW